MKIKLWDKGTPELNGLSGPETIGKCIENISIPVMSVNLPKKHKNTGAAVILLSGGGYGVLCLEDEGNVMVDWLLERGIAAFVLKYRLPNGHHLIPANDARRAIRIVRANAKDWNINPKQIGVWGFSAGGHLASTVSTHFNSLKKDIADNIDEYKSNPNFQILFYPVITMDDKYTNKGTKKNLLGTFLHNKELNYKYSNENNVTKNTPPTFLLHCSDDTEVPVENSIRFYQALLNNKIPAEMLIYERGGHGPDAFNKNISWHKVIDDWLKLHKIT